MRYSVWAGPWDNTPMLVDELRDCGIGHVRMAYAYHGGRWYLPRSDKPRVLDLGNGGVFFPVDLNRFGTLKPTPVALGGLQVEGVPTSAWLVLCHNDHLGLDHPDCCVRNAFGDAYRYALCPANPLVAEYAVELCRQASLHSPESLDVEALSFSGFEHGGLHEKRAALLTSAQIEMLSVCFCPHCSSAYPDLLTPIQAALRDASAAPSLDVVYAHRRAVIVDLLARVQKACATPINVRVMPSRCFTGGKTAFDWGDLEKLSSIFNRVTLTFFGTPPTVVADTCRLVPQVKWSGGMELFGPDRDARWEALSNSTADEIAFYCHSLATWDDLAWLRSKLRS